MKLPTLHHFTALAALVATQATADVAFGQGTIIPGNIILTQVHIGLPPTTNVYQVAYPGDAGGLFALTLTTLSAGQYQLSYYGIAEYYSLHAATPGMAITSDYISNDTPLLNNNNNPGQYQFSLGGGQSILFAYWDDARYLQGSPQPGAPGSLGPDAYDAYGWFTLRRLPSGLVIADSATAMGGGIFAGTYTAVPEPASFALALTAVFAMILRRRR